MTTLLIRRTIGFFLLFNTLAAGQNNNKEDEPQTIADFCIPEKDQFATCVFGIADAAQGQRCDACRIATIDTITTDGGEWDKTRTCEELQGQLCQAINTECAADCATCTDELEVFWKCSTEVANKGRCSLDCGTTLDVSTEEHLCPSEWDTYSQCVLNDLNQTVGRACESCRVDASTLISSELSGEEEDGGDTTCDVSETIFCKALTACACGPCTAALKAYWDCDVGKRTFQECSLDSCPVGDSEGATTTTTSASVRPNHIVPLSICLWVLAGSVLLG